MAFPQGAARATVWDYLTDPDKLAIWIHKPKSPLIKGDYAMFGVDSGDKLMWGTVLLSEPHTRLEYTFTIAPMGDGVSTMRLALDEVPGGKKLTLKHEGLPAGEAVFGLTLALDKGWDDHLARMRSDAHAD